jgi:hypothetical protein
VLIETATEIAYQHWLTEWVLGGSSRTPFVFENENSESLDGGDVAWARVSVRELTGGQETLGQPGNRKFLRNMRVFVQIFTLVNQGMKEARELASAARAVWEARRISGLNFWDAIVTDSGPDGRWQQTLVTASFFIEEIK